MFLTIGNCSPQSTPSAIVAEPAPISHKVFWCGCRRGSFSSRPANTPSRQVPIAGSVLSRPSGSQCAVPFSPWQVLPVDPVGEVRVFRVGPCPDPGHWHEGHQRPVADEDRNERDDQCRQTEVEEQEGREQVAKRDAVEHAEESDVRPAFADAAVGPVFAYALVYEPQREQDQRPAQHAPMRGGFAPCWISRVSEKTIATPVTKMNKGRMRS